MDALKRIAAMLAALCLVFQLVPAPAGAAESAAITVGTAEAYPGNSCYINVEATGLSNLASLDLEIYYDSENLTLSSVTNGSLLSGGLVSINGETPGVIKLSAAWLSGISGDGRLLRLRFTVNSDAAPGTYRVLAAVGDAHDVDLNPVEISRGTGTVTVKERPSSAGNFNVNLSFADGTTYHQGDTVNVSLVNSSWQSFASGDFKLEYDSQLFALESVTLRSEMAVEGAVYSVNKDIAGLVKVSYASVQPVSCNNLMDFVLTVIGDTDTETTMTVSATDVYTVDLVPYKPASSSENLTLEKKTAAPDYPDLYLTDLPTTVGQEGTTLLILEENSAVAAADFTVKYDPAVYQCLEVTAAEGLSETGGMVVINPTFDEGTIKFSYINENGSDAGVELVSIQWKCLSSPQTHTEVLTGGSGIVNASFSSVKLDLVPFTGCIFDSFRTEPTCTMNGEEGMMCNACGEKKDVTVLSATGHSYGAAVTPPTCTEQGFTTHTCSVCGHSYVDEYTDILPHAYESVVTPPTCTEQGFTTYTCPDCGDSYVDEYVSATGHSYGDWYTVVEATCTETGIRKHYCRNCDHSETEVTDALGHDYVSVVTEPTCTAQGYTTHTCSRCGEEFTDSATDPLGHDWDEGTVMKEPTEDAEGEMVYTCRRCGEIKTEILPALGHTHSYASAVTAPTCTEGGYTTYTCACGHSYVSDYTEALGHTEIAVPGREATCTESGLTEGVMCAVCGTVLMEQEYVPDLGHDFVNGTCTLCGEADPDYDEPVPEPALDGVYRIAGADRIATSLMLADQLKETLGVARFDTMIVASALNFPDALTGSYLAAVKSAPILLTYEAAHGKILAYIEANLAPGGTVYILGGESAVSADFGVTLNAMGIHAKRLAGADRFGTNLEIMREAGVRSDQPVLIATAVNFADSLSASAAGLPMVLVYGSLREDQKAFLATTSRNFVIIGGTSAVPTEIENELKAIGSVTRLAGSSRYETSVLVAQRFVPNPDAVVLAYARNFPDGLCGGPLAVALNAPLILTDNYDPSAADAYVNGLKSGIVVGGPGLISDESTREIFDLAAGAPIGTK